MYSRCDYLLFVHFSVTISQIMVHVPTYMYIQYLLSITEHKISTRKSGKCHYCYSITTCVVYNIHVCGRKCRDVTLALIGVDQQNTHVQNSSYNNVMVVTQAQTFYAQKESYMS